MRSKNSKQNAVKRQRQEATFAVNNKGQMEQWTSTEIGNALGVNPQQVACLDCMGFDFGVGADDRLKKTQGVNFDEGMFKRFKLSSFGNCALSEK
jgi:hypothetical protein